jgi:hypothetical protein
MGGWPRGRQGELSGAAFGPHLFAVQRCDPFPVVPNLPLDVQRGRCLQAYGGGSLDMACQASADIPAVHPTGWALNP